MMKKTKLFVEAVPLVDHQISGVPHALAGLIAALAAHSTVQEQFEIVLVAPGSRMQMLDRWHGLESCTRKPIPMKFRVMNGLARRGLLPPMDLLLGKGIYLFGNFFNWALTPRSRSLTYIHDICFALHPEYVQPDNQRMLARNVPRFIRQTDYVIAVSESARQEIISYYSVDPAKVLVLYNGVNRELYRQYPASDISAVKAKYGLGEKPFFLFVGNIEPRKNLERLIAAMTKLPKRYALMLVGSDGWLNEEIFAAMARANAMGHTFIKPRTYVPDEDVVRLISGATALALPSLHEGFGMPALEALVSGTPAVVADIPPLGEVAGDAGIYCNPHDIESIAAALTKAANLAPAQRSKLLRTAQAHTAQFTWERTAGKLAEVLRTIDRGI